METTDVELRDRTVIGADGNAIGQVAAMVVDAGSWVVKAVRIKLRDIAADQAGIGHSLFRASTIDIPVDHIQSIGDTVVLTVSARGLRAAETGAHDQGAAASP